MIIEQQIINRALDKGNLEATNLLINNITPSCLVNGDKLTILMRIMCHYSKADIIASNVGDEETFLNNIINKLQPKINNSFRGSTIVSYVASWGRALNPKDLCTRLKVLINNGANIHKKTSEDKLPAFQSYLLHNQEYSDETIKLFLDNGANINEVDDEGNNVLLHQLIKRNTIPDDSDFNKLISYGLDVRMTNNKGQSLLEAIDIRMERAKSGYYYEQQNKIENIKKLENMRIYYLRETGGI